MTGRPSITLRLSFYYAALFSVIGIQLPYWPLYLSSKGLAAAEIGWILAASYLVKALTNPLLGHITDRHGGRRKGLIILAILSLSTTTLFFWADGFAAVLLATLLSSAAFTAMLPLGDSLTLQSAVRHRLDYGRIRLWGSLSFIVISGLAGQFLIDAPRSAILLSCLAGLVLALLAAAQLPDLPQAPGKSRQQPIGELLSRPVFLLFLAVCSLMQASHMIYYGFATLHWHAAGLSGTVIGGLWAEGVIAEVVLFACGARLIARFGPGRLIACAGIAGAIRWAVLAATTDPLFLAPAQLLHAFTFGAGHLGAMHFIMRAIPAGLSARAQGIYSAVTTGIVPGAAMLMSGRLYQSLGGYAFLVMASLSLAAWALAQPMRRRWTGGLICGHQEG
ncbi:MFS transporter [Telmatospirillum siberiense]|uniref:3-phenylpropionate MFS transporter n=1 Tax=Telmatospirillum siberiense TaxID=382514 RepID=A0A2N3Q1L8_9PROT|nr:MFS transporter [Telmatospirillum siberiense]PKU26545.1 3-phenylpropionate MFS transporter [Telmatospirillum siberiense]